jgi:hypothetical protein
MLALPCCCIWRPCRLLLQLRVVLHVFVCMLLLLLLRLMPMPLLLLLPLLRTP